MNLTKMNFKTMVAPKSSSNSGQFVFTGTKAEQEKKKAELKKKLGRNAGFQGSSEAPADEGYDFMKAF
jgi:hypothetical protein